MSVSRHKCGQDGVAVPRGNACKCIRPVSMLLTINPPEKAFVHEDVCGAVDGGGSELCACVAA